MRVKTALTVAVFGCVSGVTFLEKSLVKRREGYAEYIATTSPFVPRPPRKAA